MNRLSILFALILLGITAIVIQVVLIREFIIIFSGNELSIGVILANWLILEAIGSFIAGRWAAKIENHFITYTILQGLVAFILPIMIYLIRVFPSHLDLVPGEAIDLFSILYISLFLLIPLGLISGAQFSFGCKLLSGIENKGSALIGRVYALEAIGSIIGGIITTYLCLQYLNSVQTTFLISFLNILSSLSLLYFLSNNTDKKSWKIIFLKSVHIGLLIILVVFVITGTMDYLHINSLQKQWPTYKILKYNNSVYGNVALLERSDQLHLLSNGVTVATLPTPDITQIEDFVHFPMLIHKDPKKIFLIGGGFSGILNELKKYKPSSIDYAELDPLLIKTIMNDVPQISTSSLVSDSINLHMIDGRFLLRTTQKKYDILMINLPDPSTLVLNRYYTVEFFKLCRSRLEEDGIVVFKIPGSSSYMNTPLINLTKSILKSAQQSFQYRRVLPFETALIMLSNDKNLEEIGADTLRSRLVSRKVETKLFSDLYLKYKLDDTRVQWFTEELKRTTLDNLNRDLEPIALYYDLLYWYSSLSPSIGAIYSFIEKITIIHWILITLIIYILIFYFDHRTRSRSNKSLVISIFSTGFAGMGLTLIYLLAFQAFYGYIYYWIGLIISAFMVGLSTGGFWGARQTLKSKHPESLFFKLESAITLYVMIILIILFFTQDVLTDDIVNSILPYILLIITLVCGCFVGAQFSIANKLYLKNADQFTISAGVIYASDLMGAWAGGLVITLILVPIHGIIETTFLLIVIKFGSTIMFRSAKI